MKYARLRSMRKAWLSTKTLHRKRWGFSIVEVLLASALFSLLLTFLGGAFLYGEQSTALAGERARAVMLAEEGLAAVQNIRDADFSSLVDGTYGLTTTGNQWNLSGSQDTTDIFTRQITIASVDSTRKTITANVTWQQNAQRTGSVSLITRLTNWLAVTISNWSNPVETATLDLSGSENGEKVQVSGNYAYMVRNSTTANFVVIDLSVSDTATLLSSLTVDGTPQDIFVSGDYAYVTSSDNNQELQIINIASPSSPNVVGTYNASGSANPTGVYVSGTTVYFVRDSSSNDELIIVSAATPTSPTLIGSLNLGSDSNDVVVSGDYAYIASASNSQELQVVSIATPASPSLAGSLNLSDSTNAETVAGSGTTLFLGQGSTLHTISVSTPTSPSQLGSLSVGGTINDLANNLGNSNTNLFIGTSATSAEFQVIDVSTLSAPTQFGTIDISGSNAILGIAYDATFDRAYGVGQSNSAEFTIIAPQ